MYSGLMKQAVDQHVPTEHFKILEPSDSPIDVSELTKIGSKMVKYSVRSFTKNSSSSSSSIDNTTVEDGQQWKLSARPPIFTTLENHNKG